MEVEKRDGSNERRVLIGMVTDDSVLAKITSRWQRELFQSRWANVVGKWCVDYYNRYTKAPRGNVESLFETWAAENDDKDTVRLVEKFLQTLSGEYEEIGKESNTDYLLDLAGDHFNEVRLRRLKDDLEDGLLRGMVSQTLAKVEKFHRLDVATGEGIDVLHDKEALKKAFEQRLDPLVVYDGALGRFFGRHLGRDCFVSFMAPEKRYKSFYLLDLAWRAMQQGRKVAFIQAGDLSESQIMLRFATRAARRPLDACKINFPRYLEAPRGDDLEASVDFTKQTFEDPMTYKEAQRYMDEVAEKHSPGGDTLLKLSVHSNASLSVLDLNSVLRSWDRDAWTPDVVCADYLDIFDHRTGNSGMEKRDQVLESWRKMRTLSQERHCLVATATQVNAEAYGVRLLTRKNFSENHLKFAEVTGMIGINVTDEEKELGLSRLNWIELREGAFSETDVCYVAGCVPLANPCIRSAFGLRSFVDE